MVYCDKNTKILEWGSEEIALPYISPHDSRVHRYFPDFYIKVQENTGKIKRYLIEVKPLKQTLPSFVNPTLLTPILFLLE